MTEYELNKKLDSLYAERESMKSGDYDQNAFDDIDQEIKDTEEELDSLESYESEEDIEEERESICLSVGLSRWC